MKRLLIVLLAAALLAPTAAGCGGRAAETEVWLTHNKYAPDLRRDWPEHRGRSLCLDYVVNEADDTSIFRYYSPDEMVIYTTDRLDVFFWNSFRKAFLTAGLRVAGPDCGKSRLPRVQFTMVSVTDREFTFEVLLYDQGAATFSKIYQVSGPPVAPGEMTEHEYARRAYSMISETAAQVLSDPEFRQEFFRAAGAPQLSS
jgi:hypothetical protein